MCRAHFGMYLALGLAFVGLGVWRLKTGAAVRYTSLAIGIVALGMLAGSLLGLLSLEGVEQCLHERGGHRAKPIRCLAYVERAP